MKVIFNFLPTKKAQPWSQINCSVWVQISDQLVRSHGIVWSHPANHLSNDKNDPVREAEGFYLKPIFDWGGGLSMAYVVQIGAKFLWNLRGHIGSFKSPFKCGLVYPKKCALETICSCPISDFKVWATTNCGEQSSRRGGIRKGEFHWYLLRGISFCFSLDMIFNPITFRKFVVDGN